MAREFDWDPDPERTLILCDLVQGLIATALAYCQPRQGVLVSPSYLCNPHNPTG